MDARILLVEDDPSIREVTAIGLRAAGFEVETAHDGAAGLERWRQGRPDLVLLDVMLPRLDGLEVCREIRREELAGRPGQVLSRDQLLDRVWGYDYLGDSRLVDVAIGRVRAKIERDPGNPELIVTVRGSGYKAAR